CVRSGLSPQGHSCGKNRAPQSYWCWGQGPQTWRATLMHRSSCLSFAHPGRNAPRCHRCYRTLGGATLRQARDSVLTHAERKTWAEHRGVRSQESSFSNLADMEFVFRVKLDVRHWPMFGGIEGRHLRFRCAEFPEVAAGVAQAEV